MTTHNDTSPIAAVAALASSLIVRDIGTAELETHFYGEREHRVLQRGRYVGNATIEVERDGERRIFEDVTLCPAEVAPDYCVDAMREAIAKQILAGKHTGAYLSITHPKAFVDQGFNECVKCPPWCAYEGECWSEVIDTPVEHLSEAAEWDEGGISCEVWLRKLTEYADYRRDPTTEPQVYLALTKNSTSQMVSVTPTIEQLRGLATFLSDQADALEAALALPEPKQ